MVRLRRIRLADHRGRDATVLLVPVSENSKRRNQDSVGRHIYNVRRIRSTVSTSADFLIEHYPDPDELARILISNDPEIDVEIAGRATGSCDRVHIDGNGQIIYAPTIAEVKYDSTGMELDRRAITVRPSNLVTLSQPVWSNVLTPRSEVIRKYALTRAYQVMHSNALEFDFLYSIAAYLHERKSMAQVGSGRRGNGPLILERNGPKYRGFLDGRIQDDAMRLILYLGSFELGVPEDCD